MKTPSQYFWYMAGVTSFVIPQGVNTVIFPWLIAVQLKASAAELGVAQMSGQLPALILILFGGLLADRVDPRKILMVAHVLASLPVLGLAMVLHYWELSYSHMIVFAVFSGSIMAFVQPARDGMLSHIANGRLQQTVTVTMGLTFGSQIIGLVAASFAADLGAKALLIMQASFYLVGLLLAMKLRPLPVAATHETESKEKSSALADIKLGLNLVYQSQLMRPVTFLLTFMSMFYGGTFVVLNPIIVRDIYAGGAKEISMAYGCFMIGTIAMSVFLVATGGLRYPGRGLIFALFFGGIALGVASAGLPFWGYLLSILFWGIGGGVAMTMARTMMQEAAPDAYRSRVMSVFSLANLGGMPIGALLIGFSATTIGPLKSLWLAIAGVWLVCGIVLLTSNLFSVNSTRVDLAE